MTFRRGTVPSTQEKAANLLYQVVKDHRSPTAINVAPPHCSCYFLNGNGILGDDDSLLVEGNALAAMTLMIALSHLRRKTR